MSYRQLALEERYQIQSLLKLNYGLAEIARELGRHRSTISRELKRNSDNRCRLPYVAKRAHGRAHQRRVVKGERSRKIRGRLRALVEQKLRLSWSPEQISGRLKLELGIAVCHETIYQHVLRDAKNMGFLRYCLRFGGYKQHRFKKSKVGDKTRQRKNWLKDRPAAANERSEIGHWERDCLLGKRGGAALLTIVDRRSRYARIRYVRNVDSQHVGEATLAALKRHRRITKTMTNDNGAEFQRDEQLQRKLNASIYFTDPSAPWQRGSVENFNGLVRQYVPKGTNLDGTPSILCEALEETLNHRPRKTLGYKTPHEVFFNKSVRLTSEAMMRFGLEFSRII